MCYFLGCAAVGMALWATYWAERQLLSLRSRSGRLEWVVALADLRLLSLTTIVRIEQQDSRNALRGVMPIYKPQDRAQFVFDLH